MKNNYIQGGIYLFELPYEKNSSIQSGFRPGIIISNNKSNKYCSLLTIVPLTTAKKKKLPTHCFVSTKYPSVALCEQILLVRKITCKKFFGMCTLEEFKNIQKSLLIHLGIKKNLIFQN